MMKVLVSPMNLEEALECIKGGADIIDVKNPAEGSLGANFPHVIREVAEVVKKSGKEVSATVGDLEFKPGTASLAALGAAYSGADYVKVGLYGIRNEREVYDLMKEVVRAVKDFDESKKVVAAAYGDYTRINAVSPFEIPEAAYKAGVDGIMVDTAIKDGKDIFSFMKFEELQRFINEAHERNMFCAIAGSLKWEHLDLLKSLNPDIIGVRTMVCENGRNSPIKAELVEKLKQSLR